MILRIIFSSVFCVWKPEEALENKLENTRPVSPGPLLLGERSCLESDQTDRDNCYSGKYLQTKISSHHNVYLSCQSGRESGSNWEKVWLTVRSGRVLARV